MIITNLSKCKKCDTGLKINTAGNMTEGRIPQTREDRIVAVWCPSCKELKPISEAQTLIQGDIFYFNYPEA